MTTTFDNSTTTDEVLDGIDLQGKRVFITGVSSGLGQETACALAARGATVIGTARNIEKGGSAVSDAAHAGGGSFEALTTDLADLTTVNAVADRIVALNEPFDLVIANAGIMAPPFGHTKQSVELQHGTNFVGHFVLANRLVPMMGEGARLVVLSSNAHRMSDVDLDDPNFTRRPTIPGLPMAALRAQPGIRRSDFSSL